MAVALAAELEPARLNAKLTVTGIPAGADTYTLERASPSGAVAGVRGYVDAPVGGATQAIGRDYEAPFDVPVVYTVTVLDGAAVVGTATAPFEIDYDACDAWLVDLARPTNSLPVTVESFAELAYESAAGVHRVLGRRAPIMTTLPSWTPAGELVILTDTLTERDQARGLFGSGYPFLLRTTPVLGIGNLYLGLTGFVEERLLARGDAPERRFRAACVQVERPDPAIYTPIAPSTYQAVKDEYATYADLRAAVGSYDLLAWGVPADPDVGPIPPWPPDDI